MHSHGARSAILRFWVEAAGPCGLEKGRNGMGTGDGPILAFSTYQVGQLTGLSLRQLSYWDSTGFFSPEYAPGYQASAFTRVYSFRDVVGLYTIALLRKRHHFPLQQLRRVGEYLHRYHDTPWASLVLYVAGREILFRDPDRPREHYISAAQPGQRVIPVEMREVAREVGTITERLRLRPRSSLGRVARSRHVVHNAPVLAGTRIPTAAIWNLHVDGYEQAAILQEYPHLSRADVSSALAFERRRRRRPRKAG
jgi:uncharacterized protein (DUF433 family)/DNA-binding transcriptional MerR regulator